MRILSAIGVSLAAVALAIAENNGKFQWVPDWLLLLLFLFGGSLWLATSQNVRTVIRFFVTRRAGADLVDIHGNPLRYPRRLGKKGTLITVSVMTIALVAAGFAWKLTTELIHSLNGKVETWSLFYSNPAHPDPNLPNPLLSAIVSLRNPSHQPLSVSEFGPIILWKDGPSRRIHPFVLRQPWVLPYLDGQQERMYPDDDLNVKSMTPIPPGGRIIGRLMFMDSDIDQYRIQNEHPSIDIAFSDSRGQQYSIESKTEYSARGTNNEFLGMHPRFRPR